MGSIAAHRNTRRAAQAKGLGLWTKSSSFAPVLAHFNDIGGMPAGSLSPECEEIFQERIIIPPLLIGPPST
jgi:hypothetical protein